MKLVQKNCENNERAEFLASELNNTIVINGDALDEEELDEKNISDLLKKNPLFSGF